MTSAISRLAEAEAKLTRDQAALVEAKKVSERVPSPAETKAIPVPRKASNKVASDPIKAAGRAIHDDQALLEAAKQGIRGMPDHRSNYRSNWFALRG